MCFHLGIIMGSLIITTAQKDDAEAHQTSLPN